MAHGATSPSPGNGPESSTWRFYRRVLLELRRGEVPFLLGGGYAMGHYLGIRREKDLDVFLRPENVDGAHRALEAMGCEIEPFSPHWLSKAHRDGELVDIIFSSGNGVAVVDDGWFEHATPAELFGVEVQLCPVEETIWSKAFIMERERFDGADVLHLLHGWGDRLSWHRLLARFGPHWRVLLAHLVLFGFVYPGQRHLIPDWVLAQLGERLQSEGSATGTSGELCLGTLLSRSQYRVDVDERGYLDGRLRPNGKLDALEIALWGVRERQEREKEAKGRLS